MVTAPARPSFHLTVMKAGKPFPTRTAYRHVGPAVADAMHLVGCGWERAVVRDSHGVQTYAIDATQEEAPDGR